MASEDMPSEPTLRLLEVVGQWVSGVGTLAAVVESLYLARNQRAVRLRVSAGVRLVVEPGTEEWPQYISIQVVNLGHRPVTISQIGWQIGLLRKQYFFQMLGDPLCDRVPIELAVGREACFIVALDDSEWLSKMASEISGPLAQLRVWTMKIQVSTAVGQTVRKRIDETLRKELIEALNRKKSNGSGNTESVHAA